MNWLAGPSTSRYCNVVLTGLPASTLAPLQCVMHVPAHLVCDLKPHVLLVLPGGATHQAVNYW